ncbi:glycosyltransferase family 2 protein [Lederbergia lenta]|uniref:TPR repeat-containing protein n=1 Tax=Lederbergia lenta TaxID=1467 RepID=A0A2X4WA83_LEDLE|nr:glycosyltransferase family 2 protein [Lederbergia lenta]MCM3113502.1 glycosyltransferase [Lederbergia lenta]MEC2326681.1 glycosyltransferase [Lederbergia lenta]SQI61587.1 TPR repeat-containing protein [Lederbergia lenta]
MSTISLCMIVKNEEDCIERCLDSVHALVDEIIIVDTGSTDMTTTLCKKYKAKIYEYSWNQHFAKARNYGLSQATGDWILWLDADEELDKHGKLKIQEALESTDTKVFTLPTINYYGDTLANENEAFIHYQPRLFRNNHGIRFYNRIHENLRLPSGIEGQPIQAQIKHYGYLQGIVNKKQKAKRNMKLLKEELRDQAHEPSTEYHLASEYYRNKEYERAFIYINQSILKFLRKGEKPPSITYKLKYAILIETGSFDGAWPSIEKAILLYPDYVDLYFYKGWILYNLEKYTEAIQTFEQCIELGEEHKDHLILKGVGSFKAWHHKGLCLEKLGEFVEAEKAFQQAKTIERNV